MEIDGIQGKLPFSEFALIRSDKKCGALARYRPIIFFFFCFMSGRRSAAGLLFFCHSFIISSLTVDELWSFIGFLLTKGVSLSSSFKCPFAAHALP